MKATTGATLLGAALVLGIDSNNTHAQVLPSPAEPIPAPPTREAPADVPVPEVAVTPIAGGAPPGAENILVTVTSIEIEGATVYSEEALAEHYQALIGEEVTLTRVFEVAEAIQQRYRADGYPLAQVLVPAQRVEGGQFKLRVLEGFVNRIRLEGDVGSVRWRMQAFLDRIKDQRPVMTDSLERYLLLTNDIPGVTARGVLRPGRGETGAAELIVSAERKPYDALATVNSRGSQFTGPWRGALVWRENSALRVGEEVEVLFSSTRDDEQHYGRLGYRQFIGDDGMQASAAISYGESQPGATLEPLDVKTRITFAGVGLSYPLIRSRAKNLSVEGGLEMINSEVEVLDSRQSRDDLRVLRAGAAFDIADAWGGRVALSGSIRKGLPIFDASDEGAPDLSREEGDPEFTSLYFEASRHQRFAGNLGFLVAAKGQYAFDTLLSTEEIRLGGEAFGRGYEPSELAGEHGAAVSTELQYNGRIESETMPAYQAYGFYDFGAVWNDGPDERALASLASAGIGVRTNLGRNAVAELELAKPLTRDIASRGDNSLRVFFELTVQF